MTDTPDVVKLKRENSVLRNALAQVREWLSRAFDDSQDMIDESQQYLSFINGVLGHDDEVDEFLVGADDDDDCVSPISTTDDASRSRGDSGGVA